MKLTFFGDNEQANQLIKQLPKEIEVNEKNPDVVIALGGDGTFLSAERKFSQIPKFAIRNGRGCKACIGLPFNEIIRRLLSKTYRMATFNKVMGEAKDTRLIGVNEVQIHNTDPRRSIRFKISIDGVDFDPPEIIGDGLVLATSFGATGYYQSITKSVFKEGMGLAFNNSSVISHPKVLGLNAKVKVTILRGPAWLLADNDSRQVSLRNGESAFLSGFAEQVKLICMN